MGGVNKIKTVEQLECILICLKAGMPILSVARVFKVSKDIIRLLINGDYFRKYKFDGGKIIRANHRSGGKARCPKCRASVYLPCRLCKLRKDLNLED